MNTQRNAISEPLNNAVADGGLLLQRCSECATVQYPPRERCRNCLGAELRWEACDNRATVLAHTIVHHSLEPALHGRKPLCVASLELAAGPVVLAHIEVANAQTGKALRVANARDASGAWCLVALASEKQHDAAQLALVLRALEFPL